MGHIIFIIFNILVLLLRTALAVPLIVLKNIIPGLDRRIKFERQNIFSAPSRSFAEDNLSADYMFHVSSEGELEQVRPLIHYFLEMNKRIELVFTSPSVEKKCMDLYQQNSYRMRILRLPLASFFPINFLYFQSLFSFVTAKKVIMCRYDFFPELLLLKLFNKKMILVSAATKKWSWYKKQSMLFFDLIIAATQSEVQKLNQLVYEDQTKKISYFDFRIPRIFGRKENYQSLKKSNTALDNLEKSIQQSSEELIIMGSLWDSDLSIFSNEEFLSKIKNRQLRVIIAPHKLGSEFIFDLKTKLEKKIGIEVEEYRGEKVGFNSALILNLIPGILCESFQFFKVAYIGGGYEKSIHSVLEPFVMGAKVIIGPKIHRSTEYDFILDFAPNEIVVLKNPESFYNEWKKLYSANDFYDRKELESLSKSMLDENLKLIENI